jgi:hypothetical protein
MRSIGFAIALLAALSAAAALAGNDGQNFQQIERGRYLAVAGDCAGCHTKPGSQDLAGGFPVATPFGTVVAPNITPDSRRLIPAVASRPARPRDVAKRPNAAGPQNRKLPAALLPEGHAAVQAVKAE